MVLTLPLSLTLSLPHCLPSTNTYYSLSLSLSLSLDLLGCNPPSPIVGLGGHLAPGTTTAAAAAATTSIMMTIFDKPAKVTASELALTSKTALSPAAVCFQDRGDDGKQSKQHSRTADGSAPAGVGCSGVEANRQAGQITVQQLKHVEDVRLTMAFVQVCAAWRM